MNNKNELPVELRDVDRLMDEIDKADSISLQVRGEVLTNQEISEFINEWYEKESF